MRFLTPLLLLAFLLPGPALARKDKVPDRAAQEAQILDTHRKYIAAVVKSDWGTAATYFDAGALETLRGMMEPVFATDGGEGETVGKMLLGLEADELAKLDDAQFFGAFMEAIVAMNPGVAEAMEGATMEEQGVAFGKEPDEAFVVYELRMAMQEAEVAKYAVTAMVRDDAHRWALQMTGEVKGMAEMLAASAARARAAEEAEAAEDSGGGAETAPAEGN